MAIKRHPLIVGNTHQATKSLFGKLRMDNPIEIIQKWVQDKTK